MWRKLREWSFAPARTMGAQIPRALVASVFAAALDFAVLVLLVEQARWHPLLAAVLSYLIGGVLQYILCACWVFPAAPASLAAGYLGFLALSLVGLGITGVTIAVLHDFAHVNYALAKIVALGFSFGWNFASRKLLIFKADLEHTAASAPSARVPSPRMAFRGPASSTH